MAMKASDLLRAELGDEALPLIREMAGMIAFYRRLLERFELDTLTGLQSSNRFRDFTADVENRTFRIGVIFFDVNNLKTTNDTKGHGAGDALLQKAAESILLTAVGENVHAFRTGGDEFVVLLPDCEESDIEAFLSKWNENLDELNAADDGVLCSVAVGAAYGDKGYKISEVLTAADERMYAEKERMKSTKQD